eukprot:g686.t1
MSDAAGSEAGDDRGATEEFAPENIVRVMVSTDSHLGYQEKDPVRGDDSFVAFEEVFKKARAMEVDMVLLAGDIFHENKPSRRCVHRAQNILRKNCLGSAPVCFQIVSDQTVNFPDFGRVNYEDPNYNVDLPVFAIHGNHDDPTRDGGMESLSALDLLSVTNLLNYFGKCEKVDDIELYPILMRKGTTQVALYGLGSMRDERLNRMFQQQKVRFFRPPEESGRWFSILVLHQNRDKGRGPKNCVHESMLPEFLDLVIWGHEHECLIDPQESLKGQYHVIQPGSTVATSLVEGEAKQKHCGMLSICGDKFQLEPVPLRTPRPFIMEDVVLDEIEELDPQHADKTQHMTDFLTDRVNAMIEQAAAEAQEHGDEEDGEGAAGGGGGAGGGAAGGAPPLPLLRLKVERTGFDTINNQKFGAQFVGKVANPQDILLFHKRRGAAGGGGGARRSKGAGAASSADAAADSVFAAMRNEDNKLDMTELVTQHLDETSSRLMVLPEDGLGLAVQAFVHKQQGSAINEFVENTLEDVQGLLRKENGTGAKEDIESSLAARRGEQERRAKKKRAQRTAQRRKDGAGGGRRTAGGSDDDDDDDDDEEEGEGRGGRRGGGGGQGGRGGRAGGDVDDDDDDDDEQGMSSARGGGGKKSKTSRGGRAAGGAGGGGRASSRSPSFDNDDDDDDDDDDEQGDDARGRGRKGAARRGSSKAQSSRRGARAQASRKQQKKGAGSSDEHEDEDDDDEFSASAAMPAPAPAKRGRGTGGAGKSSSAAAKASSSRPRRAAATAGRARAKARASEDSDEGENDSDSDFSHDATGGGGEGYDDDDDDDDDDEDGIAPAKSTAKAGGRRRGGNTLAVVDLADDDDDDDMGGSSAVAGMSHSLVDDDGDDGGGGAAKPAARRKRRRQ